MRRGVAGESWALMGGAYGHEQSKRTEHPGFHPFGSVWTADVRLDRPGWGEARQLGVESAGLGSNPREPAAGRGNGRSASLGVGRSLYPGR